MLEEVGLEIRNAEARDYYRRAGALVDDATQMVRMGRELVEAQLAHAPERFVLHSRDPVTPPARGRQRRQFRARQRRAQSSATWTDGRRYGDLEGFRNILRLTHTLGVLHWQGGIVVEPVDIPVPVRHLAIFQAHIEYADIVWAARGVGGLQARGRHRHVGHRAWLHDRGAGGPARRC